MSDIDTDALGAATAAVAAAAEAPAGLSSRPFDDPRVCTVVTAIGQCLGVLDEVAAEETVKTRMLKVIKALTGINMHRISYINASPSNGGNRGEQNDSLHRRHFAAVTRAFSAITVNIDAKIISYEGGPGLGPPRQSSWGLRAAS